MKLSAVLLKEKLESIIISCHYGENSEQLNLLRPEFILKKSPLNSGHLYITTAETLSALRGIPGGCCIVCIGAPPPECLGHGYTIMHVQEEQSIFDVFNRLGAIYGKYDNWERQLLQSINEKTPIQRFVDISTDVFENQIYIVDSTLRQLAKSKPGVFPNIPRDVVTEDLENLARIYASAQSISNKDEAIMVWNEQLKLRVLTKALRSHDRHAITITIIEENRAFRESDTILLDYMSYYVIMAFDYGFTSTGEEETPVSLATVLTQLLRGEAVPPEKITGAQKAFDWEPEHLLCMFYVKTPRPEHNFTTRIFQCQQLERQFTSAIGTAALDENYALVVNNSLNERYSDSILRFISILQKLGF